MTLLFIEKSIFTPGYIFEQKPLSTARYKLKQRKKHLTLVQTQTSTNKLKKAKKKDALIPNLRAFKSFYTS